jgi:hypothetical protein
MDQNTQKEFRRIEDRFGQLVTFLCAHVPTRDELRRVLESCTQKWRQERILVRMLTGSIDTYAELAKGYLQEVKVYPWAQCLGPIMSVLK